MGKLVELVDMPITVGSGTSLLFVAKLGSQTLALVGERMKFYTLSNVAAEIASA